MNEPHPRGNMGVAMRRLLLCFGVFAFLNETAEIASAQSVPQGCREDLLAAADPSVPHRYNIRRGRGYCDGEVPVFHRGEIRIVSFTLGPVVFPGSGAELKISRPPSLDPADVLFIRGEDKRGGRSYRLDGAIPTGGLALDLMAAVRPSGIGPDHLGLVAWRDAGRTPEYWPVVAGVDPRAANDAILVIRTPIPVVQMVQQICERDTDNCRPQELIGSQLQGGSSIEIGLPRSNDLLLLDVKVTTLAAANAIFATEIPVAVPARDDR